MWAFSKKVNLQEYENDLMVNDQTKIPQTKVGGLIEGV